MANLSIEYLSRKDIIKQEWAVILTVLHINIYLFCPEPKTEGKVSQPFQLCLSPSGGKEPEGIRIYEGSLQTQTYKRNVHNVTALSQLLFMDTVVPQNSEHTFLSKELKLVRYVSKDKVTFVRTKSIFLTSDGSQFTNNRIRRSILNTA